ncbi:MAG: transposase family protein, partial [Desulfobacteraceae bacterium]|nr:transposase family protein [Desulfobacteraceae bacterium]
GEKKHWLLAVDDYSNFSWSSFLKKKNELKDHTIGLIKELKAKHGILVKIIRLDNSGENNALEKLYKQEGLGIKFEYTVPGTPQQNGRVERKFQTLYGRLRSSLLSSGIKGAFKKRPWAEAANTATDLDNILVKQGKNESSFQHFFGKEVKSLVPNSIKKHEMAVITNLKKIKATFVDQGNICIWIGYAKDHAIGIHHFSIQTH